MKQIKHIVIDYIYILIGSAITGLGITLFTTPAKIAPGGVSGIATILYHLFGFDVGTSILFLSIKWHNKSSGPSKFSILT